MHPEEIKIELFKRRKDISMASIGRQLGCSRNAVKLVIERKSVSEAIMRAVARAIEQPAEKVFPERFNTE